MSDLRQTPAATPKKYRESRTIRLRQSLALALLALTGALLLYWWRGHRHAIRRGDNIAPVGLSIRQTAHGFSLSRSEGGKPVFRIYADQAIQLKQGSQATLKNVRIDLYDRDGVRADQIYGQAFAYDPSTGIVTAQGMVHIDLGGIPGQQPASPSSAAQEPREEAGRPIHIQTSDMVFNTRTGIGEVRKGLDFSYLGAQGKADSAHVATHPDVLTLQGHVQLHWTRADGPPVAVTSDSARLDKGAALVELDGNAAVATGPQHLRADRLQFLLRPDYSVRQALAIGHVSGTQQEPGRMLNAHAAQAQAFFAAPPRHASAKSARPDQSLQLTSLHLTGGAQLQETAPRQNNRLTAGSIALLFGADGGLQTMQARQNAALSLVSSAAAHRTTTKPTMMGLSGSAGSRSISAPGLDFYFNAGKSGKVVKIRQVQSVGRAHVETRDTSSSWMTADANLFSLDFDTSQHPLRSQASGDVLLKQQPAPVKGRAQPLQISQSDHLLLQFLPGQNRLKDAVQSGHVQLLQAGRRMRADQLTYDPIAGVALFQSVATSSFTHGQVLGEDATMRFRSPQAKLNLHQNRIEGWGGVQVSFLPGTASPSVPNGPMFQGRLPVDITADRMNVLEKSGQGTFDGHVRLWQGQNLTLANSVSFNRTSGEVLASGGVVSAFVQPASGRSGAISPLLSHVPGKTPPAARKGAQPASPISITAERLAYSDQKHQGTYLGHVVLTSAQARLTANKLQFDLAPAVAKSGATGPAVLQRVTATEDVQITQPGRVAKAQTVVYDMAANRITMRGGPPSIYDAEHGYLTGETLTFSPSNDTIRVESEPGKRTFGEYRVKH